jgi:hypothetical protein
LRTTTESARGEACRCGLVCTKEPDFIERLTGLVDFSVEHHINLVISVVSDG